MLMKRLFTLMTVLAAMVLTLSAQTLPIRPLQPSKKSGISTRDCTPTSRPAHRIQAASGEVKDEHGIITTPAEGQRKVYLRAGTAYYLNDDVMNVGEQDGILETIECADGTIYIKDIISNYGANSWVKGTKNGSTITIPTRQPILYVANYDATVSIKYGYLNSEEEMVAADNLGEYFVFHAEDGVFKLEGTSTGAGSVFMGIFWDDDNAATGYGDALTTWTPLNIIEQVDELPYVNDFETDEQRYSFNFIDANHDGITWNHIYNTDDEHYLRYQYNTYEKADDWAVSPAIKLEAGKLYCVAFDTRSSSSEERIEMKMGKEATPEAMTQVVFEPIEVAWDENKTFENRRVSVEETGYYYFGIHAISNEDTNRLYADNFTVEEIETGAPAAITDLAVVATKDKLEATVTFTAPSTNIIGETLTGQLTSIELLRDGDVIHTFENVTPGTAISYTDQDEELTLGNHTYQVIAYNDKGMGEKSETVTVFLDTILEVPYTADLTDEDTFGAFRVLDANEDGSTWGWEEGYYTNSIYNSDNAADDYLISPRLHLQGGKNYNLVVNALTSGYTERMEVKIGKEPTVEGLSTVILEPVDVTDFSNEGEFFEKVFSVAEDGIYYIALHAISDADMDRLTINSLTVEDGPAPTAPAAPELAVVPDAKGELLAEVKVTAPTLAFNGSALSNLTKIDILRDGEVIATLDNVAIGAPATYTDKPEEIGHYTYQVIPYNADGMGMKSEKVTVYVGVDTPRAVETFTVADNGTSVTFNWDKVGDVGYNDLYVNPEKVDYNLYSTFWEQNWWGGSDLFYNENTLLGTVRDADTYTLSLNTDEGDQEYQYWVIVPQNEAGEGENTVTGLLTGAPYQLPLQETFTDDELHYFWDTDGEPMSFALASDGDKSALALLSTEAGVKYFSTGKISIKDVADPVMAIDLMATGISQLTVKGSVNGGEMRVLQENIPITQAYTTINIPLSTLKDGRYAQVTIEAEYTTPTEFDFFSGEVTTLGDVLAIDNIRIGSSQYIDGIQEMTTDETKTGAIYTLDGRQVRTQADGLKGLKGIYVVKGKKFVVK